MKRKYLKKSTWYGILERISLLFLNRYLLLILLIIAINISLGLFTNLVWWGVIFPLIVIGYLFFFLNQFKNIFLIGFAVGFIIWMGGNILFSYFYKTEILLKISTIKTQYSFLIFLVAGLIGGSINGLSLYIGKLLFNLLKK